MIVGDGADALAALRVERQGLRAELEAVKAEIRSTRLFNSESTGYEREAKEQRARLSAVGLFKHEDQDGRHCPLCESWLETPVPSVAQVTQSLRDISEQLEAVEAENPRLQFRLAALQREENQLEDRLRENEQLIQLPRPRNKILQAQQDNFILQALTIGKISQYLETALRARDGSALTKAVEAARSRVTLLEQEVDAETVRERIEAYLNIIGRYMTDYSADLDLEHKGSQLRLDIKNLTVVADTLDGPVPLQRMGSGENWVGYHVLAHLALHRWFRQKRRPVPAFLILDQPSQAHYPPDRDTDEGSVDGLGDEDKAAVRQLFALVARVAGELAPDLQIIVMDHADRREEWFENATIERWRRGQKLFPRIGLPSNAYARII